VVDGGDSITLLIRGVGPTLSGFGVAGAKRSAAIQVGAFTRIDPSRDAALLVTLAPGAYTVLMDGCDGASGNGLIEIYEVLGAASD